MSNQPRLTGFGAATGEAAQLSLDGVETLVDELPAPVVPFPDKTPTQKGSTP